MRPAVHLRAAVTLAAGCLLLAGCGHAATSQQAPASRPSTSSVAAEPPVTSGTPKSPSSSKPAPTKQPSVARAAVADAPPEAAMVCSSEVRHNIATLLGLAEPPSGRATWVNKVFTCAYDLPAGHLVLTVKDSPTPTAAKQYLAARESATPQARPITGLASLGLPAFENTTGTVVFVKDNFTLIVDATHLTGRLGPSGATRTGFAYALATDVLACWSE